MQQGSGDIYVVCRPERGSVIPIDNVNVGATGQQEAHDLGMPLRRSDNEIKVVYR